MKELFDRHEQRLTPAERHELWWSVAGARTAPSRSHARWALAATAMALAAVALVAAERGWIGRPGAGVGRSGVVSRDAKPSETGVRDLAANPGRGPARPAAGDDARGITKRLASADPGRTNAPRARPSSPLVPQVDVALALPDSTVPIVAHPGHRASVLPPSASGYAGTGVLTGVITDAQNRPVPYANVILHEVRRGVLSAEDGSYRIDQLPPDTYTVQVSALGHDRATRAGVQVGEGQTASADVRLHAAATQVQEIEVHAGSRVLAGSSTTKQALTADRLKHIPADKPSDAAMAPSGVVAPGDAPHFRGGRSGEVKFGASLVVPPASPPVIPITGGTVLPNDEPYDAMFFKNYGVNPFVVTEEDALSTFAVDVDHASYTVTRRYLELGHLPPAEAVRVEEFVNSFPQGYPKFENDDFRILVDGAPSRFGRGYHLLRIGLKGREVSDRDRTTAHLTFVVDVSGSMAREDRLGLVKQALRLLVDELGDDDRVGIVIYGSTGQVLLEPTRLGEPATLVARGRPRGPEDDGPWSPRSGRRTVLRAIEALHPGGSTNAEEGLRLGYDMARRDFRRGAINRIVLCSDGVANVGRTGPQSILEQVRTEADRGIHLSTIGFGMGNYNDVLMEQLANRGDGNYYYVDDLDEARRVLVENATGTLQTIARDAKVQVEFDPKRVLRYRLLGFENREVVDRDFRNDRVDAGEIGAGHEVTALYEVKLAPGDGRIGTVRLRYARPEHEGDGVPEVREIATDFGAGVIERSFEDASPRLRLDAAIAEFAEILRGSYWAKDGRLADVSSVARSAARDLREDGAEEFVELVGKAERLERAAKPGGAGRPGAPTEDREER